MVTSDGAPVRGPVAHAAATALSLRRSSEHPGRAFWWLTPRTEVLERMDDRV